MMLALFFPPQSPRMYTFREDSDTCSAPAQAERTTSPKTPFSEERRWNQRVPGGGELRRLCRRSTMEGDKEMDKLKQQVWNVSNVNGENADEEEWEDVEEEEESLIGDVQGAWVQDLPALPVPWQYKEARECMEQKRWSEARELYAQAYGKILLEGPSHFRHGSPWGNARFALSRMVLCNLGVGDAERAALGVEEVVDQIRRLERVGEGQTPPSHLADVYLSLAAYFLDSRDLVRCCVVALRGMELFSGSREVVFSEFVRRCLKDDPGLLSKLEEESTRDSLRGLLCQPPQDPFPELRATPKCLSPEVLSRRAAWCLKTKRSALAMSCLHELAALPNLPEEEGVLYQYCVLMAGMSTGSTTDPAVTQRGLEALLSKHSDFFEIHYGLAEMLVKMRLHDEAEKRIRTALTMNSEGKGRMFTCWPQALAPFFPESGGEVVLEAMLRKLLILVETAQQPESTCRFEDCVHVAEGGKREIYLVEGKGYNTVVCSDRCSIDFHQLCWRKAKELRGNTTAACFTPGELKKDLCVGLSLQSSVDKY